MRLSLIYICNSRGLFYQHRIAKGKEAVLFLYGNFIGSHGLFVAVESRDQHDEGAFRQVEVGDQAIDAVELDMI